MSWLTSFWRSSIGGKVTMAVTGLMLFGFVVSHLLGNLQLLQGPDKINSYAKWLHDLGPLLWIARIGLLAIFVVIGHVGWTIIRPISWEAVLSFCLCLHPSPVIRATGIRATGIWNG
jgi:succinate dehydrogenase/fumarate reductase cytochrome b subunit